MAYVSLRNSLKQVTESAPYWLNNVNEVFGRLNWSRLLDSEPNRRAELEESLGKRNVIINLDEISNLWRKREDCNDANERLDLTKQLVSLALWIPNNTHPEAGAIVKPTEIYSFGEKVKNDSVVEFSKFCNKYGFLRDSNLGNLAFPKSYHLKGPLAELEGTLVRYSLNSLVQNDFQLISVPDIIYPHVIESCGMKTTGERDQVFWLESPNPEEEDACLSGTAEMSIAGSLQNRIFNEEDLPLKLTSVSRCFRAETSNLEEEKGIYRVHEFTKVEMFGVTANETGRESNDLHADFRKIEENLFADLNIHFKTLEMPPVELGASAFRKFDIEAWMAGRKLFGEISSTSNCTDFQSRRLNIRYRSKRNGGDLKYVHTVNGTACAVPRLLITLIETFQQPEGIVELPAALKPFMIRDWKESLNRFKKHKDLFLRTKSQQDKYVHNVHK